MKKLIVLILAGGLVAGCETPGQTAMAGAATGAAIGAATAGQNETRGALIGAATGLAAGAAVAAAQSGPTCRYRYPDGSSYTAPCPEGY